MMEKLHDPELEVTTDLFVPNYLMDGETEAERGCMACSRSQSYKERGRDRTGTVVS